MHKTRFATLALTLLMLSSVSDTRTASAQNTTGNIVGTIVDSSGNVVPKATVFVTNKSTNDKRTATTNETGEYQVLELSPGQYKLDVDVRGFKHYTRDPVEVQVELTTRANVALAIGLQTETVTVNETVPIIQSDNATLGQVIQERAVTEIPLNGRNVLALVGLVPGVVPQGGSNYNLTGQNVFAAGNFQIGGGAANQSSTLYDGIATNVSYGNATLLVPSQDAVQEFRVQTSSNTAEYGNYTGGVINITSKSGSNAVHGTVYEYVRNTMFNATPYFSHHNSDKTKWLAKNPYHQNQFGANVGFPIIKDKLFAFFDYQGYRQALAQPFNGGNASVPTARMKAGDFGEWCTAGFDATGFCTGTPGTTNNQTSVNYQLYDPCPAGTPAGGACPGATGPRAFFPYNKIPANRMSTVAQSYLAFHYWADPTGPGTANAGLSNNFSAYAKAGGVNDQYNGRVDYKLSEKQSIFTRYTLWSSTNIGAQPFGNGLIAGDPISPEAFKTRQLVVGDTYLFSPSLIGDLRLGWLRWNYVRTPGTLGFDPTKLGFPSYMGQISNLNQVAKSTTIPSIGVNGLSSVNTGYIFSKNNNYTIAPTITKTWRNHTFRAGADLRRMEQTYFQNNNAGGTFGFDSGMTAKDNQSSNTSNSGLGFASFLLGYMNGGLVQISNPTYYQIFYQGYFVQDSWNITSKLTLTAGLRYEVPGEYRERHDWMATFNPTEVNSVLGNLSIALPDGTSKNVLGAFDLVDTPQHPAAGLRNEHFSNFSPRIGVAYRLDSKTVIRAGFGKFFIPSTLQFPESPVQAPNVLYNTNVVSSIDGGITPNVNFDNPLPTGLVATPKRDPRYQQVFLGSGVNALNADEPSGYNYQWNFAVQSQLPLGVALEAAYAGAHGSHLPQGVNVNQIPNSVTAKAFNDPLCNPGGGAGPTSNCFLTKQYPNPFNRTLFSQGNQQNATLPGTQLFRPFPQYGGINNNGNYIGLSNYNALQMKLEKRFNSGGMLLGSYTYSKLLTNVESLTSWLESNTGAGQASGIQNSYNLRGDYSLSGYDSKRRLVVSYVYNLPIGHGEKFLANVSGLADRIIGGFGVNGVTTLQDGFPLGLGTTQNNYNQGGGLRPNVVSGCNPKIGGPVQKRLGDIYSTSKYFNPACYTNPTVFTFGNEPREDGKIRKPGQANYDLAVFKDTTIKEGIKFQLRVEGFNIFNRTQFGAPNGTIGSGSVGTVGSQVNNPRTLQIAGRVNF